MMKIGYNLQISHCVQGEFIHCTTYITFCFLTEINFELLTKANMI